MGCRSVGCRSVAILPLIALGVIAPACLRAAEPSNSNLEHSFEQTVRPFLATYCVACHSGSAPAANLNLKSYSTVADVVQDLSHWNAVVGRLKAGQMPPKAMKQPPAETRQQIIDWIQVMRLAEARKNAGDPGVVLARRLSNAEYNYTIRDLTGVDLRPTREFPVDPANTAGFDNSGESLSMSPARFGKYLAAARLVADHVVLKPEGFVFAPHPAVTDTDRDKYCVRRIVDFYGRHRVDFADYFLAAWRFRHRARLGRADDPLSAFAAEAAHASDARLVLTARCENHLHGRTDLEDTIERAMLLAEGKSIVGIDLRLGANGSDYPTTLDAPGEGSPRTPARAGPELAQLCRLLDRAGMREPQSLVECLQLVDGDVQRPTFPLR